MTKKHVAGLLYYGGTTMLINQKQLIRDIDEYSKRISVINSKATKLFRNAITDTISNTVRVRKDRIFVATGDIPAMWLRDSTFQVLPYLELIDSIPDIKKLLHGVLNQQLDYINLDPYANAFNETASGAHYNDDHTEIEVSDLVWERKFEIDSLCAPLFLAANLYIKAKYKEHLTPYFWKTVNLVMDTFISEQHHENSSYVFNRDIGPESDTLSNGGRGAKVKYTGMVWSGFRPSDDACQYGFFVPGNMFIIRIINLLSSIIAELDIKQDDLLHKMRKLRANIEDGINNFAVLKDENGKDIFAYEVDGIGNVNLMDDANVPSLLSIPFIGYTDFTNRIYQNTREFILSSRNPYYYEGKVLKGIGSPHTPKNYVWPIALAMEGITSDQPKVMKEKIKIISSTDAGTYQCHEGINVDNPNQYTREWFSWANMTYCQLVLTYLKKI